MNGLRRSIITALALTAAATVTAAAGGTVLAGLLVPRESGVIYLLAGGAALLSVICFVFLGLWLYFHVRQPLLAMLRTIETDAPRAEMPQLAPELAPITGSIAALDAHLAEARRDRETLLKQQDSDPTRNRLEAILRDLSEGVVVCNLEHQVLLFNRMALWQLGGAGAVGLGRSVFGTVRQDSIAPVIDNLLEFRNTENRGTISFDCMLLDRTELRGRVTLTQNQAGEPDGYVLTLTGGETEPPVGPPPRQFYDLQLFSRPAPRFVSDDTELGDISFVVFDTETTGLEPDAGDEVVSLAGVRVRGGQVLVDETFDRRVNPGRPIPPRATRVHGITDAMVASAPALHEILPQFRDFVGDAVLVAHFAAFDMSFLERAAKPLGLSFQIPVLDTMLLSAAVHDHAGDHGLDAIAARFDIPIPPGQRHTALGDALVTAEILTRLIDLLAKRGLRTLRDARRVSEQQSRILHQRTVAGSQIRTDLR